jgi:hypothetical protein
VYDGVCLPQFLPHARLVCYRKYGSQPYTLHQAKTPLDKPHPLSDNQGMSDENKIVGKNIRPSVPGERRGGRPKGVPNKTTALLKDAILMAATDAHSDGLVGYLKTQAVENPGPFMSLLGKVLPMQITGEAGGPVQVSWLKPE